MAQLTFVPFDDSTPSSWLPNPPGFRHADLIGNGVDSGTSSDVKGNFVAGLTDRYTTDSTKLVSGVFPDGRGSLITSIQVRFIARCPIFTNMNWDLGVKLLKFDETTTMFFDESIRVQTGINFAPVAMTYEKTISNLNIPWEDFWQQSSGRTVGPYIEIISEPSTGGFFFPEVDEVEFVIVYRREKDIEPGVLYKLKPNSTTLDNGGANAVLASTVHEALASNDPLIPGAPTTSIIHVYDMSRPRMCALSKGAKYGVSFDTSSLPNDGIITLLQLTGRFTQRTVGVDSSQWTYGQVTWDGGGSAALLDITFGPFLNTGLEEPHIVTNSTAALSVDLKDFTNPATSCSVTWSGATPVGDNVVVQFDLELWVTIERETRNVTSTPGTDKDVTSTAGTDKDVTATAGTDKDVVSTPGTGKVITT